ncbi:heterocycloanthracin/sonorensin family bacteriocin [Paenibacillus mesophilus]|uniref:heterocycloanthracin/sonorensin family bacteriocin n=1 Tax=Paenibacillus mesophilus TaxID=2582849 RepID=UPI00110DD25E|nr:heterocycloanthracin/sonorensin family bacteriocin [Paenibacillus mesophilus]
MSGIQNELEQLSVNQFQAGQMTPWNQQYYPAAPYPAGQNPADPARLCVGIGLCSGFCSGFCGGFCGVFCSGFCSGVCGGFCGGLHCGGFGHRCGGFCHHHCGR